MLKELEGHYTPLKAALASVTTRGEAQLQQDLRSQSYSLFLQGYLAHKKTHPP